VNVKRKAVREDAAQYANDSASGALGPGSWRTRRPCGRPRTAAVTCVAGN